MHPSQSAFLFGIPFYAKINDAVTLHFAKIQLGHFNGTVLHTRSTLLSLIARQEPQLHIVAEDDLGRSIFADNGQPLRQTQATDSKWTKFMEIQSLWNKVRDRAAAIQSGNDIANPAGSITQAKALIADTPSRGVHEDIIDISVDSPSPERIRVTIRNTTA